MTENNKQDMAVSIKVQQAAALYGIVTGLTTIGSVANKKRLKKAKKVLRQYVLRAIGDAGKEILKQNQESVIFTLNGCGTSQDLDNKQRKELLAKLKGELSESMEKGLSNFSKELGREL
tara:strand:+ start:1663 stop:2019 length:357 start_codon:yes stop_codon:yes gene_type:complete